MIIIGSHDICMCLYIEFNVNNKKKLRLYYVKKLSDVL